MKRVTTNTPPTKKFNHPDALCPCGSGAKAKRCCGTGNEKVRVPGMVPKKPSPKK